MIPAPGLPKRRTRTQHPRQAEHEARPGVAAKRRVRPHMPATQDPVGSTCALWLVFTWNSGIQTDQLCLPTIAKATVGSGSGNPVFPPSGDVIQHGHHGSARSVASRFGIHEVGSFLHEDLPQHTSYPVFPVTWSDHTCTPAKPARYGGPCSDPHPITRNTRRA